MKLYSLSVGMEELWVPLNARQETKIRIKLRSNFFGYIRNSDIFCVVNVKKVSQTEQACTSGLIKGGVASRNCDDMKIRIVMKST